MMTLILFLGVFVSHAFEATIGYIPKTLPRDPVEINLFLEHAIVGQVLETLIKIDTDGNVAPGLAEKWEITQNGHQFIFTLRSGLVFSDGSKLTSEDVLYSLGRHQQSTISQSKGYFDNVQEMKVLSPLQFQITLKQPQVALLKILTRDHLGIVPKGWVFKKDAESPWIGTGPYVLMKRKDHYYLEKNPRYRDESKVRVSSWKILQSDDVLADHAKLEIPDVIMHIPDHVQDGLRADKKYAKMNFYRPLHFIQTSAWWYPLGKNHKDQLLQSVVTSALDELVQELVKTNGHELATGIIPKGISGYLPSRKALKTAEKLKAQRVVKVAVTPNDFEPLFGSGLHKKLEAKYNILFEIHKMLPGDKLKELAPDVYVAAYAGGFPDPDGFMIVLTSILGQDFKTFLGPLAPLYTKAQSALEWTERTRLFKELGEAMLEKKLLVPLWKKDMYVAIGERVVDSDALFKYSLRLHEFDYRSP